MKKTPKRRVRSSSANLHRSSVPFGPSLKPRFPNNSIVSPEPPAEDFVIRFVLKPQNDLRKAVEAATDIRQKARQFLKHEDHAKLYGANPAHVKMVEDFAAKHGLKVVASNAAQRTVLLSGSPRVFSEAFRVQLVTCVVKGKRHRCRTGMVYLPADLAPVVAGVFNLDDRAAAHTHVKISRELNPKKLNTSVVPGGKSPSASTSTGNPAPTGIKTTAAVAVARAAAPFLTGFTPAQVAALYNFPKGLDGTGQTIAILELGGGYRLEELNTYFGQVGIKTPNVKTFEYTEGGNNNPGTDPFDPENADVEVMLDIEVAGSVAPGANIVMYFGLDASDSSFLGALSAAIHDTENNPSVISISWGGSEDSTTQQFKTEFDTLLQSAALLGITVCVASGDDGSADFANDDPNWDSNAHVDFPASDPYALACGGTQLNASDGKITSEIVWNEGTNDGSGGGVSRFFALPDYQKNSNVPPAVDPAGAVMCGVPDVAGNAAQATGYQVLCDGQKFPDASQGIPPVGGTSAVAPLWAGLIACINQSLGTRSGFINPLLYNINAGSNAFHDISQGNNGAYQAGQGWDPCTGLGSPDGQNLLQALQPAAPPAPPAGGSTPTQPPTPPTGTVPNPPAGTTPSPTPGGGSSTGCPPPPNSGCP